MKESSKSGFTLAELLIVVAILGILVGILLPVFGAQLNKVRAASELARVRSKYAELVADAMLDLDSITGSENGEIMIDMNILGAALQYKETTITIIDGDAISDTIETERDGSITVTYKGYSGSFPKDADVSCNYTKYPRRKKQAGKPVG